MYIFECDIISKYWLDGGGEEDVFIHKHLLVGAITSLKNDGVRQWVSDDIPYDYPIYYGK